MKRNPAILATLLVAALTELFLSHEGERTGVAGDPHRSPGGTGSVVPVSGEVPVLNRRKARLPSGRAPRQALLDPDFLERTVSRDDFWEAELPDGRVARGPVDHLVRDAGGTLSVSGRLEQPEPGRFFFQRQTVPGVAGEMVGHVIFDQGEIGWKVEPRGAGGTPVLVETDRGGIICVSYAMPPQEPAEAEHAPSTHPSDIPIPSYQQVIPLQSLPGASGVIYLDFDGEAGPFTGWGDFDAAPSGASNEQVKRVWQMVAEDFQGFALNVTTDRRVFDEAGEGRRQHVVITPTSTAAPGYGGVAFIGSYNWSGDTVCWAFYSTGKAAAEVISHEVGHTLGLGHDGRQLPGQSLESYYAGHGNGATGWAPIMGAGYSRNLTQWSKGEYDGADRLEDDLEIIATYNNDVGYREDDAGGSPESTVYLEIFADESVVGEGIIGRSGDVDGFRFTTSGGAVDLEVEPVELNPNLDVHAEIQDVGSGQVVGSSNPEDALDAGLTMVLPAGEYFLKVRGTGRGDPLGDGYSDYGSLGSYRIHGTVSGGVAAERFDIAENTPDGTPVGTVSPRREHGTAGLSWSITGGNEGGVFEIDAASGILLVADGSRLDYESLSLRWDEPAEIELFVSISDSLDSAQDETLRVVVTVANVNEAPEASDVALTLLERTRVGTKLLVVTGSDPDPFDFPTFSIASGDPEGWFAIDPGTGVLRVNGPISVDGAVVVPLEIRLSDQGSPARATTAMVTLTIIDIAEGHVPGGVMRTYFEGILGSDVEDLTDCSRWPDQPDSEEFLPDMDGGGHGNYYGSTLRGHVIPPETGSYRFWVSSDDASELWLSDSEDPAGAELIATVGSWSKRYSWPVFGSQQSGWVSLTAGVPYYIEVRHKSESGADHAAVGWTGPGIPKQLLKGIYLSPYLRNYAPVVSGSSFQIPEEAFPGQVVGQVTVRDVNLSDVHGAFAIVDGDVEGKFSIDPSSGRISLAAGAWLSAANQSTYQLLVSAGDNGSPPLTGTGVITVNVRAAGEFPNHGIHQQVWTGISTTSISALTGSPKYPHRPDLVRVLPDFDSGPGFGGSYGSRIRALVTPPVSGDYTFHLSSDDNSVLLLGSGASPASAVEIASVPGSTSRNDWSSYPSQTSAEVFLTGGQSYYIETLHKEWGGDDHIQVGWTGPGIASITVIPGSALQPFDLNVAPVFASDEAVFVLADDAVDGTPVGVAAASDPEGEAPVFAITESISPGVFAIDPYSGEIRVADSGGLTPGVHHLTVAAQDQGIGGTYPLRTASRSVTIAVESSNSPPAFPVGLIELVAFQDQPVSYTPGASDPDGDPLAFAKTGGPGWLSVDEDGDLSGIPRNGDVGSNVFTIRVTDGGGLYDEAVLSIEVIDVNDPPFFSEAVIEGYEATEDAPYTGTLDGLAVEIDSGDSLSFSKVSGPEWLEILPDGTLSGTAGNDDVGLNLFVVRVADSAGGSGEASLEIRVINTNDPPLFSNPQIPAPGAVEDQPYLATIADQALDPDPGEILHFVKLAGPDWLSVSPDGALAGVPENGDVGLNAFTVQVSDASGELAQALIGVEVGNSNDPPVFDFDPLVRAAGMEGEAYPGETLAGSARDEDAGDVLKYSVVTGPAWLVVAEDGSLAGSPPAGSAGLNTFTIRVTDLAGAHDEASLLIEVSAGGLPLPWASASIGGGLPGSAGPDGTRMEVEGSGTLSGRNDGFEFVWQTLGTNASITARVDSIENAGPGARAGVMIRDTLASNSRHVFMGLAGSGEFRWERRTGFNGNTSSNRSGSGAIPAAWVRLVREGNRITSFKSPDGVNWTTVGSLTADFPDTCYFGLAVASGDPSIGSSAMFSHLSISP